MRGMYFLQVLWDNTLHVFNKICKRRQASDKARAYSTSFNINTQSGIRYLNFQSYSTSFNINTQSGIRYLNFQSSLLKDITCPNLFPRFPFFSILIRIVSLRPSWILHMCIDSSPLPVSKKKKSSTVLLSFLLSCCFIYLFLSCCFKFSLSVCLFILC